MQSLANVSNYGLKLFLDEDSAESAYLAALTDHNNTDEVERLAARKLYEDAIGHSRFVSGETHDYNASNLGYGEIVNEAIKELEVI